MPTIIECPKCQKKLKIGDDAAGTRVRCPACQFRFTAPGDEDDATDTDLEEPSGQHVPQGDTTELEENDEPGEENENPYEGGEEEDRPRKRRRKPRRSVRKQSSGSDPSVLPLVLALLAVTCSCAPLVGAILAYYAMNRAADAMGEVPPGTGAWTRLNIARILSIVAYVLCVIFLILGAISTVANIAGGAKH
jgi:hypothetical protein